MSHAACKQLRQNVPFEVLKSGITSSTFLRDWSYHSAENVLQLALMDFSPPAIPVVKLTITVTVELVWTAALYGSFVPMHNTIMEKFPSHIQHINELESICFELQRTSICQGNSRADFVSLVEERGGVIHNREGGVIASIDCSTVRHVKLSAIHNQENSNVRSAINYYSRILRALLSRKRLQKDDKTSHNSHTNYRYLQKHELAA